MEQKTPYSSILLNEETIISTPLPQATSTVDKRPDLLAECEVMEPEKQEDSDKSNFLTDELTALDEMRKKLMSLSLTGSLPTQVKADRSRGESVTRSQTTQVKVDRTRGESATESLPTQVKADRTRGESVTGSLSTQKKADRTRGESVTGSLSTQMKADKTRGESVTRSLSTQMKADRTRGESVTESLPNLPQVSPWQTIKPSVSLTDLDKRSTYTVDNFSSEDMDRKMAREKALKTIAFQDLIGADSNAPVKESLPKEKSLSDTFPFALPNQGEANKEISGFSELLHESDLQKDEMFAEFGNLPIKPVDLSLSGIYNSSQMSNYFRSDDSLLNALDRGNRTRESLFMEKENVEGKKSGNAVLSGTVGVRSEGVGKGQDGCKEEHALPSEDRVSLERASSWDGSWSRASSFSEKDIDEYIKEHMASNSKCDSPEVLRVSEIAKLLQDVPVDATPTSLVKKVLEVNQKKSTSKQDMSSFSIDSSFNHSSSSDDSFEEEVYEAAAVFGGGTEVHIEPTYPSPDSLWSFVNYDEEKIIAKIKKENPTLISVVLFPRTKGDLCLKIQELSQNNRDSMVLKIHKIMLTVELPKIKISPINEIDFGLVPECTTIKHQLNITLENSNMVILCPKFSKDVNSLFSLEIEGEEDSDEINLYPEMKLQASVVINPKMGFCKDVSKTVHVVGALKFCLLPQLNGIEIDQLKIKAEIFCCKLQVVTESEGIPMSVGEKRKLLIKNTSPCCVTFSISTSEGFRSSSYQLKLTSSEICRLLINYQPKALSDAEGSLTLKTVPGDLQFQVKLYGMPITTGNVASPRFPESNCQSNSGSVNSSFSTSGSYPSEVEGSLKLECTQLFLVWSSKSLGAAPVSKSCWLRSKSQNREKLVAQIIDPSGSFHLVTKDGERRQSTLLTLSSMQRKELLVEFSPKLLGQTRAELIIKRVHSDADKRQIYLFAYGGYGHLRAEDVAMDLESKSFKIPLRTDSLSGHFTLRNVGDGTAFFKISQRKVEGMFLEVSPTRGLLEPGDVCSVSLTFTVDRAGPGLSFVEELLHKDRQTDVHLSSLTVTYGDQPTRLRIARLYKCNVNKPELAKSPQVSAALANLCSLFPSDKTSKQCVSLLKDPLSSVWSLFEEGIHEWNIEVIVPRQALENVQLDTTQQFISFAEQPLLDETENTTMFDNISAFHHF